MLALKMEEARIVDAPGWQLNDSERETILC